MSGNPAVNYHYDNQTQPLLKQSSIPSFPTFIVDSFEDLPEDKYLFEEFKYRRRRYSCGIIKKLHGIYEMEWLRDKEFFQPKEINKYLGNVVRNYKPLSKNVLDYVKENIAFNCLQLLPAAEKSDYEFGIHQIRVSTKDGCVSYPAPEGFHKDGYDYIGIICVNYNNIEGGTNLICLEHDESRIVFEKKLNKNELVLLDDELYKHYISPIVSKLPGTGFRDVFVISFNKIRESEGNILPSTTA